MRLCFIGVVASCFLLASCDAVTSSSFLAAGRWAGYERHPYAPIYYKKGETILVDGREEFVFHFDTGRSSKGGVEFDSLRIYGSVDCIDRSLFAAEVMMMDGDKAVGPYLPPARKIRFREASRSLVESVLLAGAVSLGCSAPDERKGLGGG